MDFADIATKIETLVNEGAPAVELLAPEWAPAVSVFAKLLTSAANAEPHAVDIYTSIKSGQVPAAEDVEALAADYGEAVAPAAPVSGSAAVAAKLDALPATISSHVGAALINTPTVEADSVATTIKTAVEGAVNEIKELFSGHAEPAKEAEPEA